MRIGRQAVSDIVDENEDFKTINALDISHGLIIDHCRLAIALSLQVDVSKTDINFSHMLTPRGSL